MLTYGFGAIGESVKNVGFNIFLLFYYNQVLHVSATGTSIVLAIALVFDAVTDPIAGSLSDKLQSRWGRRHPFILFSALPLAFSFYMLFNPPVLSDSGYLGWLLVFAILVRGSMTFYHVPHLALGAEMATDYRQRSTLYGFATFFGFMGASMFVPLSYLLFFPTTEQFNPGLLNQAAYSPWGIFSGGIIVFAILTCVLGTFSEVPHMRKREVVSQENFSVTRLIHEVRDVFANRSFRAIFFGMMLTTIILSVEGVFNQFMGFHFYGMTTEQLSLVPIGQITGLVLALFLTPLLTRRFDKKPTLIGCALIIIGSVNLPIVMLLLDVSWFPARGSTPLLLILMVTIGCTTMLAPVVFASLNSMFADIADEHELDIGERREGIIFSARSFAVKATASLGLVFGGMLLDFIRFPRGASLGSVPDEIVWQLGFIAGPATSIFTTIGVLMYMGYRIDNQRHQEIMAGLKARRPVAADD
ncbi:MAG: MFS transporter [Proteobacteria bacterium]|nr:MFS transporter [Pseudomonadota bacterium]